VAGAAAGAIAAGCSLIAQATPTPIRPSPTPTQSPPTPTPTPTSPPTASPSPSPPPVSLRRRAARLLVVGFKGRQLSPTHWVIRAIEDEGIGGLILFARNIASRDQLIELTATLREAAASAPLLIAVDQEGGTVARLGPDNGYPSTPSAATVGRQGPGRALEVGRQIGQMLAGAGINLNLAPVVDLNVNPDNPSIGALGRSFSADPDVVVELAGAVIGGMHESGVLATLKHFPGLGSATGDTDRQFVDVTDTWMRAELEPFARLVADELPDAVMAANALNGQLDDRRPSSLSAATIELLRAELGWNGVVITDDLQAGALSTAYADDAIVRLALDAGDDLLLFANTQVYKTEIVTRTLDTIEELVAQGELDEAQVDKSVARIERMLARATGFARGVSRSAADS
jgi:beta-N-acetylhexosaminidase